MATSLFNSLTADAILLGVEAKTNEEVIRLLASRLHQLGYVKDSYADAVVKREQSMPTGLPLERSDNVAVPHTDPEHVLKAAIAMATLKTPVDFANMEDPDETVGVGTVFLLAINDKDKQIETLQSIMGAIQSPEILDGLKLAQTTDDLKKLLG
ncbi:PTS sugar transporter subunit IIA [Pseudochrobactrum algeriensis]|uniref:PTS sugar transporter subunit IIA n=1 Tax=Pseudochrobactrum algeriensis TaxID=2834768 RepID=UPI001BD17CF0|nr:PTS sugar transporter subunit IIA [Pseudochrobactrum algeriensis]MBX8812303.1 PTS sugar transporter subunit IIA [Ochrobactrum sp. MR34]QVQ37193.1 PTS sugar transporter subunit IIA [Pseudochrobactrum algeriensis]QVQ40411.1 PTS sugar transporter subunit IIA [Pseudochrobactrum algeriensis]QVQ44334.1 PTS sugar transporter subunit IIA [Pseudochrobactrum algeriensis]